MTYKTVILHNIITSYKTALFNELYKKMPSMEVVYIAETETRRDWKLDKESMRHPHNILFQGAIDKLSSRSIFTKTWKILNEINPDFLIVGDYSNIFGWAGMLWGKLNKRRKMVFWFDSTYEDKTRHWYIEWIKKLFINQFAFGITPGIQSKKYLEFLGLAPDSVIATGYAVDNEYFTKNYQFHKNQPATLKSKLNLPNRNFLFVGRFAPEKNIFQLLHCFKTICDITDDWGLILIGDGVQKKQIESYVKENDLSDRVHLPGFVQQKNITQYFLNSDVFILPSLSEPWGLVVNEAMICKLPVVVSDQCGCHPELVQDGINGFVYPVQSGNTLLTHMQYFVHNYNKCTQMGEESNKIIQNYTPQIIASRIAEFITQIQIDLFE